MAGKYLYGNLNQETVRSTYGGSTTDSVKVTVDNDNMVISADVIWDAALGELSGKAYPGDKGARNYTLILQLTEDLENEIKTASESRSGLTNKVEAINIDVNKRLTALTSELTALSSTSTENDNEMFTKLAAETQRALRAEADLLELINNEQSKRAAEDTKLSSSIQSLLTANSNNQSVIEKLIADEEARATAAEKQLSTELDQLSTKLNNLGSSLRSEISSLAENIDDDYTLQQDALSAEATEREKADAKLAEQLTDAEDVATKRLDALDRQVSQHQIDISTAQTDIVVLNSKVRTNTSELADIRNDLKTTNEELDNAKKSTALGNSILQQKLDQTNETLSTLSERIDENQTSVDAEFENVRAAITNAAKDAKSDLDEAVSIINNDLASTAKTLSAQDEQLEQQIQDSVENLTAADVEIEAHISAVNELVVAAQERIEVLETARESIESRLDTLEGADGGESYSEQINNINTVLLTVDEQIKQLTTELSDVQTYIDVLSKSIEDNETAASSNEALIEKNTTAIAESIIRITACEKALTIVNDAITKLEARVDILESDIVVINSNIAEIHEQLISLNKELNSVTLLAKEVERQDNEHSAILTSHSTQLNEHEVKLIQIEAMQEVQEEDIQQTKDDLNALRVNLVVEQTARGNAISVIRGALEDEIRRATSAEKVLTADVANNGKRITDVYDDLVTLLNKEVNNLKITDERLYELVAAIDIDSVKTQLNDLLNDYSQFKSATNNNISGLETSLRLTETRLQTQIDNIDVNKNSISKLPNDGSELTAYTQLGEETGVTLVTSNSIPESIVLRDSDGNIHIPANSESTAEDIAVSKSYVEKLVKDLLKDVDIDVDSFTFDFIEGGNAPVD